MSDRHHPHQSIQLQQQSQPLLESHDQELAEYDGEIDGEIEEGRKEQVRLGWNLHQYRTLEILSSAFSTARHILRQYRWPGPTALWNILPRYLQPGGLRRANKEPRRTMYLDALRGYAACCVMLHHMGIPEIWILQQAPFAMFFDGAGMVDVFFVISGYVLTSRMIKLIRQRNHEAFLTALASSIFRRYLRLYGSSAAATFIVAVAGYLNLFPDGYVHRCPTFWRQLQEWAMDLRRFSNPFDQVLGWLARAMPRSRLLPVLWTIPVEFRGSMIVFVFCTMTCKLSPRNRMLVCTLLILLCLCWEVMYAALFLAATCLAELGIRRQERIGNVKLGTHSEQHEKSFGLPRTRVFPIINISVLLVSFILLSQPGDMEIKSWPWPHLWRFVPFWFTQGPAETMHFWPSVGAVLLVFALDSYPPLRYPLEYSFSQYLGEISFGIYVSHMPIIVGVERRFLVPLREEYLGDAPWAFGATHAVTSFLVFWVADYFTRMDRRVVYIGRWLESRLFIKDEVHTELHLDRLPDGQAQSASKRQ